MKILLIDDSPFILKSIQSGLETRFGNCEVITHDPTVDGFPEASEIYGSDLIVLDHYLGGVGDGLGWLNKVAGAGYLPPVVMISGDDSDELQARARRAGVLDFIGKDTLLLERLAGHVDRLAASVAA